MKCEDVELNIADYLDKRLDNQQVKKIEEHLGRCESCLDMLRDTQEIFNTISARTMETPDESLKINFYHMLHNEIRKAELKKTDQVPFPHSQITLKFYRYAAAILLLLSFILGGSLVYLARSGSKQKDELATLRSDVNELRKSAMLTMMRDGSSSSRIQAVSYADEIPAPDADIITALINTLNNDRNVNVRMAAAYALTKFSGVQRVRDSLVSSLAIQTDPIMQVTLINILVELREKRAYKPVENIIYNDKTLKEVRSVAENSLRYFL